jgi:hypothetical protein
MRIRNPRNEAVARTEAERYFVTRGLVALAGDIAEKRARRGSGDGWEIFLTENAARAYHEAAHAVAVIIGGLFVLRVSIVPDRGVRVGQSFSAGHVIYSRSADTTIERPAQIQRDHSQAARAAWLLTPFDAPRPRWRHVLRTVRALRSEASQIIEQNWLFIAALACELQRTREMDRAAIERVVWGRMSDA